MCNSPFGRSFCSRKMCVFIPMSVLVGEWVEGRGVECAWRAIVMGGVVREGECDWGMMGAVSIE